MIESTAALDAADRLRMARSVAHAIGMTFAPKDKQHEVRRETNRLTKIAYPEV